MAIIKVAIPASVPATVADYQAQNAHLSAFINQVNSQAFILTEVASTTVPALKQGAYINHAGVLYVVDGGDEAISGSPSDGNVYIKLSVSGATLVASFVNDISGYAWNSVYGYLASGTDLILPYLLVKATAAYTKYRMEIFNMAYIALQCTTLTASGAIAGAGITSSAGVVGTYKSGTVWAAASNITENTIFDTFSFIPVGATIIASGMFGDNNYDYTMVAIQRTDATNIVLHRHKDGDNTIFTTTCTDGDATVVASWINISY